MRRLPLQRLASQWLRSQAAALKGGREGPPKPEGRSGCVCWAWGPLRGFLKSFLWRTILGDGCVLVGVGGGEDVWCL